MAAEDERDNAFLSTWLLTRFSLIQDWNGEMWVNTVGKLYPQAPQDTIPTTTFFPLGDLQTKGPPESP